jgi:hypothetical protein
VLNLAGKYRIHYDMDRDMLWRMEQLPTHPNGFVYNHIVFVCSHSSAACVSQYSMPKAISLLRMNTTALEEASS